MRRTEMRQLPAVRLSAVNRLPCPVILPVPWPFRVFMVWSDHKSNLQQQRQPENSHLPQESDHRCLGDCCSELTVSSGECAVEKTQRTYQIAPLNHRFTTCRIFFWAPRLCSWNHKKRETRQEPLPSSNAFSFLTDASYSLLMLSIRLQLFPPHLSLSLSFTHCRQDCVGFAVPRTFSFCV